MKLDQDLGEGEAAVGEAGVSGLRPCSSLPASAVACIPGGRAPPAAATATLLDLLPPWPTHAGVLYYGDTAGNNVKASTFVTDLHSRADLDAFVASQPDHVLTVVNVALLRCLGCGCAVVCCGWREEREALVSFGVRCRASGASSTRPPARPPVPGVPPFAAPRRACTSFPLCWRWPPTSRQGGWRAGCGS